MNDYVNFEYSAGGIVVDLANKKVLVIKTKNLKGDLVYTFPKGHIEKGETTQDAAIREVREETGVEAKIIKELKDVNYWFVKNDKKIHKNVKWFLMQPINIDSPTTNEVEEVFWYDIDDVEKILTYSSDRELIRYIISQFIY
ncbi:MAG: NUDIX hydrolase [Endomicrobia bacterium]|nr:NUDIX hydrolase [Endomicrobiia bacterium]